MKKSRIVLLAAVVLSLGVAAAVPAEAESFWKKLFGMGEKEKKAAAANYLIHDEASFKANTTTVHMRPYNDASLEFDIAVPKYWTAEDMTKNQQMSLEVRGTEQRLMGDLARVQSEMIGVYRVDVSIATQQVEDEISAQNWLKYHIFKNGYALQGEVEAQGPFRASAHYSSLVDQINYFTYVVAYISGGTVIVCSAVVPLQIKDLAAFVQEKIPDSLKLTYPKEQYIEDTKNFALVDALRFSYPVSWQPMSPDFKDMTRLSVQFQNKDKDERTVIGFIRVFAVRRSAERTLAQEIEEMKKHFSEFMEIDVKSLTESTKIQDASPRFPFTRMETYKAAYKKEGVVDPEVRLAVAGDKSWYIIAYLVSQREQDNLYNWAHNVRSFEVIAETMH